MYECAALYPDGEGWLIADTPCDVQMHFICEFDLNAEESEVGLSTGKVIGTFIIKYHVIIYSTKYIKLNA